MKNKTLNLRISDEDKSIIDNLANELNMTTSDYVISCALLGRKIKVTKNISMVYEVEDSE